MVGKVETTLAAMGVTLPEAPAPVANYVPYVVSGNLVFVSGQIPKTADGLVCGQVGNDVDVATAQAAAKICALNLIAQLKSACGGDLDRVTRVVKLGGFVNCTPEFGDHPAVINGASDFMAEVFGAAGAHARAAVGSSSLPMGAAVEVEGIFEIS